MRSAHALVSPLVRSTVELLEDDVWVAVVELHQAGRQAAEHVELPHCVAYGFSKDEAVRRVAALWRSKRRARRDSELTEPTNSRDIAGPHARLEE